MLLRARVWAHVSWIFRGRAPSHLRPVISHCWMKPLQTHLSDSRGNSPCASCFWRMSLVSTHTLTIRKTCLYPSELYLIQADMQTDMSMHIHTQKKARATCSAGLPNYHQLLCINKPWHKSSDESATPNTLETLPRLAHRRRTGQIGG